LYESVSVAEFDVALSVVPFTFGQKQARGVIADDGHNDDVVACDKH
jgi:hypothetical protein